MDGVLSLEGEAKRVIFLDKCRLTGDTVTSDPKLLKVGLCWAGRPTHGDDRNHIARFHGFANVVRVIAPVRQQNTRLGQVVVHNQIEAQIVRCLARSDVRSHGQTRAVDAEVDLGRETTS